MVVSQSLLILAESYRPDTVVILFILSMITAVRAFLCNEAITEIVPADATLITIELIHLYRSVVESYWLNCL